MSADLFAPEQYWRLSPEVKVQLINGCGPGHWKVDLVPDTLWGLDITEACQIHDYQYAVGMTIEQKDEADRIFLNNMLRLINVASGWRWLRRLRQRRAYLYYLAVSKFGGPAFWAGKNPPETLKGEQPC